MIYQQGHPSATEEAVDRDVEAGDGIAQQVARRQALARHPLLEPLLGWLHY